jgi:hypothetical protein
MGCISRSFETGIVEEGVPWSQKDTDSSELRSRDQDSHEIEEISPWVYILAFIGSSIFLSLVIIIAKKIRVNKEN